MPSCGIEKLYVAKQISDTSAGLSYDTPRYFKNVQELDIKPKTNNAKAYAENRLVDQQNMFDSADISISRFEMTADEEAYLLGKDKASKGGVIGSLGDEAPFVAALYKAPIRTNDKKTAYRYGVIYSIIFEPPDNSMKALEGKPDFSQVPKLSGTAQSTEWSYKDTNGNGKHPWEWHIDTTDPNCPKDIDDTWFKTVPVPSIGEIVTLALSSSTPAANATGIAIDAKPALTFNNILANYVGIALLDESDNTIVSANTSVDATGKIVTITPTANLTVGKTYDIILSGITDIYGQTLEQQVIKFSTVSA